MAKTGHGIAIGHLLAVTGLELFRAVSAGPLVTSRYKSSWFAPVGTGRPRQRERRRPLDAQGPTASSAPRCRASAPPPNAGAELASIAAAQAFRWRSFECRASCILDDNVAMNAAPSGTFFVKQNAFPIALMPSNLLSVTRGTKAISGDASSGWAAVGKGPRGGALGKGRAYA